MKIILLKDIAGLGRNGEIKEVSVGYGRNFLIPKHFAMPATSQILERIQKEESEEQEKIKKNSAKALELKKGMEGKVFEITAKSSGQSLFAALHQKEIADAINQSDHFRLKADQIVIKEPIKKLGEHTIEVIFSPDIHAQIKIRIKGP